MALVLDEGKTGNFEVTWNNKILHSKKRNALIPNKGFPTEEHWNQILNIVKSNASMTPRLQSMASKNVEPISPLSKQQLQPTVVTLAVADTSKSNLQSGPELVKLKREQLQAVFPDRNLTTSEEALLMARGFARPEGFVRYAATCGVTVTSSQAALMWAP